MTTPSEPWTCPACRVVVATTYCPGCGERFLSPQDLTLRGLLHQAAHATTSIDGRLLRSLRDLLLRPGALTQAYLRGNRRPFIGPFQLFLIVNVLFFAFQSLVGTHVFSTPLDSHLHHQDWSALAREWVERFLARRNLGLAQYAPVFDQAVETNAKSLIVLMVPPFALASAAVFFRAKLPAAAHLVFSLHFHAFLLVLFCAGIGLVALNLVLGGPGLASPAFDHGLATGILLASGLYLYLAAGTVFGARGGARIIQTLLLTCAVALIVTGYRFLLLPLTLLST